MKARELIPVLQLETRPFDLPPKGVPFLEAGAGTHHDRPPPEQPLGWWRQCESGHDAEPDGAPALSGRSEEACGFQSQNWASSPRSQPPHPFRHWPLGPLLSWAPAPAESGVHTFIPSLPDSFERLGGVLK